ncbi:hypothetical protein [Actinotignum timonense]|uniref:hypothetical protein n=1 Tax=Actinotignum timonense TaxID=1870995 RepID=UPI002A7EE14F|nr:hypothetical protein [Actinotignum timonense]
MGQVVVNGFRTGEAQPMFLTDITNLDFCEFALADKTNSDISLLVFCLQTCREVAIRFISDYGELCYTAVIGAADCLLDIIA